MVGTFYYPSASRTGSISLGKVTRYEAVDLRASGWLLAKKNWNVPAWWSSGEESTCRGGRGQGVFQELKWPGGKTTG